MLTLNFSSHLTEWKLALDAFKAPDTQNGGIYAANEREYTPQTGQTESDHARCRIMARLTPNEAIAYIYAPLPEDAPIAEIEKKLIYLTDTFGTNETKPLFHLSEAATLL